MRCCIVNNKANVSVANKSSKQDEAPTIKSMLKADHGDLIDKQRRAKNVIVTTGLKTSDSTPDPELFQLLCFDHLGVNIEVTNNRRLGQAKLGRTQPLLVSFNSEETLYCIKDCQAVA